MGRALESLGSECSGNQASEICLLMALFALNFKCSKSVVAEWGLFQSFGLHEEIIPTNDA